MIFIDVYCSIQKCTTKQILYERHFTEFGLFPVLENTSGQSLTVSGEACFHLQYKRYSFLAIGLFWSVVLPTHISRVAFLPTKIHLSTNSKLHLSASSRSSAKAATKPILPYAFNTIKSARRNLYDGWHSSFLV